MSGPVAGLCASGLAAVASFLIALGSGGWVLRGYDALALIPGGLIAIAFLVAGGTYATYRQFEDTKAFLHAELRSVRDHLHVTVVGSPRAGLEYISNVCLEADEAGPFVEEVLNTRFNLAERQEHAEEQMYGETYFAAFLRAAEEYVRRGGRWLEVGDPSVRASAVRFTDATRGSAGRYDYRLLNRPPQVNFTVLRYRDGRSEALFNWDYRSDSSEPVILRSTDYQITDMFKMQFSWLRRYASMDASLVDRPPGAHSISSELPPGQ